MTDLDELARGLKAGVEAVQASRTAIARGRADAELHRAVFNVGQEVVSVTRVFTRLLHAQGKHHDPLVEELEWKLHELAGIQRGAFEEVARPRSHP